MAYLETGLTHIAIQELAGDAGERVAEVRGWGDTSTSSKQDISIIGNVNAAGRNVKRFKSGSVENQQTITMYFDKLDPVQAKMRTGYRFYKGFIVEGATTLITYNDCEVINTAKAAQEIDGLVGFDVTIAVNGDIEDT